MVREERTRPDGRREEMARDWGFGGRGGDGPEPCEEVLGVVLLNLFEPEAKKGQT